MSDFSLKKDSSFFLAIEKNKKTIFGLLLTFFFIELLRTAWISDDIKLTLRTVLNFLYGYGPVFNIDERVQIYTHPLWFFLLYIFTVITRNIYFATFLLSISSSLIAFSLFLFNFSKNVLTVFIFSSALLLSKAFIDFSSSGLENPLSYVLIILIAIFYKKAIKNPSFSKFVSFFSFYSLLYLSRPDLILLTFPLLVLVCIENRKTYLSLFFSLLIGALPAILWTLFSLYYYGFPFPNTAYAKLATGISFYERIDQGFLYLLDSLARDPLTLSLIFLAILTGFKKNKPQFCFSLGLLSYIAYIIFIGGDFMSGRFLAVPFLFAAIQCVSSGFNRSQVLIFFIGIMLLSLNSIQATWLSSFNYSDTKIHDNGIADERAWYFEKQGLLNATRYTFSEPDWKVNKPFKVVEIDCGGLGNKALNDGPNGHFLDNCALADPFLSHLNKRADIIAWRIGHVVRPIPENYIKSIKFNQNDLKDPLLHDEYNIIREMTRGNLNDMHRWETILDFNFSNDNFKKNNRQP